MNLTAATAEQKNSKSKGSRTVFGHGHTIWKFAESTPPDKDGWQTCAVDPDVIAARVADLSYGFCIYDEVGNIWSLKNGKFQYTVFPNRFCYSRESGSIPYLEIWTEKKDSVPPEAIKGIEFDTKEFPAGEALIRWITPEDSGGGKTLGFQITYKKEEIEKPIPRYLIPMAGKPGEEVRMHIHDIPFKPGEVISLIIRPVDSAGNTGNHLTKELTVSSGSDMPNIPEPDIEPFPSDTELPTAGMFKVSIVDMLDKINPETGVMIPPRQEGYKGGNHIFSAKKKLIRLQAAGNETVCFQLNLMGVTRQSLVTSMKSLVTGMKSQIKDSKQNIRFNYIFDNAPNLKPRIYQFGYVNIPDKHGKSVSLLPDPLIPLKSENGEIKPLSESSDASNFSLICELYVPHEETPGKKKGKLTISVGKEILEFNVELTVWNFRLPDKLSFIPEMNVYGTVSPYSGYEYYRLAHEHRTCINRLPYGWDGNPHFAPKWKGEEFDWQEWDQKVAPLLDGSAFHDLPRKNEPVDVFYLPFSENYPVNLFDHYTPSYWADESFSEQYQSEMRLAFAAFAKHCEDKKWHDTIFQFYLNNKLYYREKYPKNSAPWIFDEPVNTQDFWAIRWYGILWHSAVSSVAKNARMWYRADISYTQFARNILWGVTDVEYLGGNNFQKTRMKHDEQTLFGRTFFAEYGTANKIEEPNTQPVLWCLSAWSKGSMGVLPWQTIGSKNCWNIAEQTALFYPHPDGVKPSVRLKAFARGQQDVEYLTLLSDIYKIPRFAVADWLKKNIDLQEKLFKTSETDAGTLLFEKGDVFALWRMRYKIGKILSDKAPPYRRSLVNYDTPHWNINRLPDIGYVPVAPEVESYKPDCDNFKP